MLPQSAILLITGGGYTELPCPTLSVIITVTKKIFKTLSLSFCTKINPSSVRYESGDIFHRPNDRFMFSLRVWQSCFDDLENLDVSKRGKFNFSYTLNFEF